MKITYHSPIFIFLFLLCNGTIKAQDIFVYDDVWKEYATGVHGSSIMEWLNQRKIKHEVFQKKWKVPDDSRHWLYYRNRGLRVWFKTRPEALHANYNSFKSLLLRQPKIGAIQKRVSIQKIAFQKGTTLLPSDLMFEINLLSSTGDPNWKKVKEKTLEEIEEQLLEAIQRKNQFVTLFSNSTVENDFALLGKHLEIFNGLQNDMALGEDLKGSIEALIKKFGLEKYGGISSPRPNQAVNSTIELNGMRSARMGKVDKHKADNNSNNTIQNDNSISPNPSSDKLKSSNGVEKSQHGEDRVQKDDNQRGGSCSISFLPLPIKIDFSKWIQVLLIELLEYLHIKELTQKALVIAYLIAPELIENCAHFFNELNELTKIKKLDQILNKAADIYQNIDKYLSYLKDAHALLTSTELADLVNKVDLKNIRLDDLIEPIDDILPSEIRQTIEKIEQYVPIGSASFNGIQNLTTEKIEEAFKRGIEEVAIQQMEHQFSNHGLNIRGFVGCSKKGDCKEWVKEQTNAIIQKHAPKEIALVSKDLINGDIENAALKTIEGQLKRVLPANVRVNVFSFYNDLKNGNYEKAIKEIGRNNIHHLKEYTPVARAILEGRQPNSEEMKTALKAYFQDIGAKEFSKYIDDGFDLFELTAQREIELQLISSLKNLKLDPGKIKEFINRGGTWLHDAVVEQIAKDMGFDDIIVMNLIQGNFDKATELMLSTRNRVENYRAKALRLRQIVTNRAVLTRVLLDLSDDIKQYSKKELEQKLLYARMQGN